jgi:uncharacterized protein (DUF924 family)
MDYNDIIKFWFNELTPQQWFQVDQELDRRIREDYLKLHYKAVTGELEGWREYALGRLAEIIVIDQFSRNMFRNTPLAFAYDSIALVLAQEAVRVGADKELDLEKRGFLYMPYMHSESQFVHELAVPLFSQKGLERKLDYELRHKDIIDKFGRYPHRNEILGRKSTPEEIEFLKQPGSKF